jgi:hypothetical protein
VWSRRTRQRPLQRKGRSRGECWSGQVGQARLVKKHVDGYNVVSGGLCPDRAAGQAALARRLAVTLRAALRGVTRCGWAQVDTGSPSYACVSASLQKIRRCSIATRTIRHIDLALFTSSGLPGAVFLPSLRPGSLVRTLFVATLPPDGVPEFICTVRKADQIALDHSPCIVIHLVVWTAVRDDQVSEDADRGLQIANNRLDVGDRPWQSVPGGAVVFMLRLSPLRLWPELNGQDRARRSRNR